MAVVLERRSIGVGENFSHMYSILSLKKAFVKACVVNVMLKSHKFYPYLFREAFDSFRRHIHNIGMERKYEIPPTYIAISVFVPCYIAAVLIVSFTVPLTQLLVLCI